METAALREAIAVAGGQTALANALGIKPQAVQQWKKVPPERVLDVERLTGVDRYRLRPDIYGPPAKPERKRAVMG